MFINANVLGRSVLGGDAYANNLLNCGESSEAREDGRIKDDYAIC